MREAVRAYRSKGFSWYVRHIDHRDCLYAFLAIVAVILIDKLCK